MATIPEAIQQALALHQRGQLTAAESLYAQILKADPRNAVVLNLLGALRLQQNRPNEATTLIRSSLEIEQTAGANNNIGGAYLAAEKPAEAEQAFREAIRLDPRMAKYQFDLGLCLKKQSRHLEAIDAFREAVNLAPEFVQAWYSLGTTLTASGSARDALSCFQEAISRKPDYASAFNGLGNAFVELGRSTKACEAFENAVRHAPLDARIHCNLGVARRATGDRDGAESAYRKAIELRPNFIEVHRNLASLLVAEQQFEAATEVLHRLCRIAPQDADAHIALGDCYRDIDSIDTAIDFYGIATKLNSSPWVSRRAEVLCRSIPDSVNEIAAYRQTLKHQLELWTQTDSKLCNREVEALGLMPPFSLLYHGLDNRIIKEQFAAAIRPTFDSHKRPALQRRSRPRIGFFVTNGHEGIFVRCMRDIVASMNRQEYEVVVAAPAVAMSHLRQHFDESTTTLLSLPDRFDGLAPAIRAAHCDVLYYWECGTDVHNYFLPFCRPAPIQCTGWGVPDTTGVSEMDYYLTSNLVEPDSPQTHYTEQLICANGLLTSHPVTFDIDRSVKRDFFGLTEKAHVYACLQNPMKIHPDMDSVFYEILNRDPEAIILLADGLPSQRVLLECRLEKALGSLIERLKFISRQSFPRYLRLVELVDVALDPFYFGAGITAFEHAGVGTPIVTRLTAHRRGRFATAINTILDAGICNTDSVEQYVEMAVRVASDRELQRQLRTLIQSRCTYLVDVSIATKEFEQCIRTMLETGPND